MERQIPPKFSLKSVGTKLKVNIKVILSLGHPSFPGFPAFPGILNFCNKYTGFVPRAAKIVLNGRIHCELQIRVQDFENFNQRKFCEPLNI